MAEKSLMFSLGIPNALHMGQIAKLLAVWRLSFGVIAAVFVLRRIKAIPHPWLGVDVSRMSRVRLDFFSQLIDKDTQIFCFLTVVGTPYGLQHSTVRNGFSLIGHHVMQQFKFFRCKTDDLPSSARRLFFSKSIFKSFEIKEKEEHWRVTESASAWREFEPGVHRPQRA